MNGKCTCKRCKGTGQVPTHEKQNLFRGIDFSGPKFITCKSCHGTGKRDSGMITSPVRIVSGRRV